MFDIGSGYAEHDIGLWLIERNRHVELSADCQQLIAIGLRARFWLPSGYLMRRLLIQFFGCESGIEHRMTRLFNE